MSKAHIPYHCSFLLSSDALDVKVAICWRRVANSDYGLYIACENEKPEVVVFKAINSNKGVIESFLVCDCIPKEGMKWEEDHISNEIQLPLIEKECRDIIRQMGNCFYNEWIESFGASDAAKIIKKIANIDVCKEDKLATALNSELPFQIKSKRKPDILEHAELTENNELYSFIVGSDIGNIDKALLENKMKKFFELI